MNEAVEPKLAMDRIYEKYESDLTRKKELINQVSEIFTPIFENGNG